MAEAFRCSQCRAPVQDDRWTSCPYCGTVLARATVDPLRAVVAPERFAAAERDPSFAAAMRHAPSGTSRLVGLGFTSAFLLAWTVGTGIMTVLFLPAGPLALVPAAMTLLGIVLLVRSSSRVMGFASAPLERRLVVWRDERVSVHGGGENDRARTQHFVLLEDRDGKRVEVPCDARAAGQHAPGDIGIAYLRGGVLLDFRRIEA